MTLPVTIDMIDDAAVLLKGAVLHTPTVEAQSLGQQLGCRLSLKLENLQHTSSFKVRGSFVKLQGLSEAERKRGVVAMSAGNHAQAWPITPPASGYPRPS